MLAVCDCLLCCYVTYRVRDVVAIIYSINKEDRYRVGKNVFNVAEITRNLENIRKGSVLQSCLESVHQNNTTQHVSSHNHGMYKKNSLSLPDT